MQISIKTLFKNAGTLVISNAAAKLINFLLLPLYTTQLDPTAYGITDTVLNTSVLLLGIFSLCMDWGMEAHFYNIPTEDYYAKITTSSSVFFVVSAAACMALVLFSGSIAKLLLSDINYAHVITLGIAVTSVELLYFPFRVSTRMRGKMKIVGQLSIVQILITIVCNFIFIFVLNMGYLSLVMSSLISYCVVAICYLRENEPYIRKASIDLKLTGELLKYSIPILPNILLTWVNNVSDRYVIGYFYTQAAVGLYGVGARMVGFLSVISGALPVAYASFAVANASDETIRPKYSVFFDAVVMFFSIICFGITLLSKEIVYIMTAPAYHEAYVVVGYLIYGHAFYILQALVGYGITIAKRAKYFSLFTGVAAALNLVLNILVVPRYGYVAAASTTLLTHFISFILCFIVSEKLFYCGFGLAKALCALLLPIPFAYLLLNIAWQVKLILCIVYIVMVIGLYWNRSKEFLILLSRAKKKG